MNLWKNWKEAVWETFPDLEYQNTWAEWEGKGTNLTAKIYKNKHFIKSREVGEMEGEPAYKRAGVSLDDGGTKPMSSSTLTADENGNIDIKSNNTFLHDNVD